MKTRDTENGKHWMKRTLSFKLQVYNVFRSIFAAMENNNNKRNALNAHRIIHVEWKNGHRCEMNQLNEYDNMKRNTIHRYTFDI